MINRFRKFGEVPILLKTPVTAAPGISFIFEVTEYF